MDNKSERKKNQNQKEHKKDCLPSHNKNHGKPHQETGEKKRLFNQQQKNMLILFIFLIFSVILFFSTRFENAFNAPKFFCLRFFTIIIFLYWIYIVMKEGFKPEKHPLFLAVLGYFLLTVLSLAFSRNALIGLNTVINQSCYITLFFIMVDRMGRKEGDFMVNFFLLIGGLVGVYSVIQHVGLDPVRWAQSHLVKNRSISTLGNPDFLSAFLVMIIPPAFVRAYREEGKRGWLLFLLWGFLCFVNLWTYSRTGIVSMTAGMILCLLLMGKKVLTENRGKTGIIIVLIIVSLLGLFITESLGLSEHSLMERISAFTNPNEINVATRIFLWKTALLIIKNNPVLGTGPDTIPIVYLPYRYLEPERIRFRLSIPESSHNLFLDIGYQSGIPALICFLVFLGYMAKGGIDFFIPAKEEKGKKKEQKVKGSDVKRSSLPPPSTEERLTAVGYSAGIFAYLVHNLSTFPTISSEILFWIFSSLVFIYFFKKSGEAGGQESPSPTENPIEEKPLSQDENGKNQNEKTESPSHPTKIPLLDITPIQTVILVLLVLAGILLVRNNVAVLLSDYEFKNGRDCLNMISLVQDPQTKKAYAEVAIESFRRSSLLEPGNYRTWLFRGKILETTAYLYAGDPLSLTYTNESIKYYLEAIKMYPQNPYAYADLGRLYATWQIYPQALASYQKAVALDPYNPVLITDLAKTFEKNQDYASAEEYFLKAYQVYSLGHWTSGNLGLFYYNRGNREKAVEYLEKSVSINDEDPRYKTVLEEIKTIEEKKEGEPEQK